MKRRSLKQDKLAQVYDAEILPIWAERFGRMLLAEATIPQKGLVLNVACGTGYPALDLLERMDEGRIIAIDSSSALLDVAREKAGALSGKRIFFRTEGGKDNLSFDDDVYDLTFSNLGIDEMEGTPAQALAELARVTAPGGQLLVTLPLRGTWAEFLDIYREVLTKHDRHDSLELLAEYEATLPEPDEALRWMEAAGLTRVDLVVDEFSLLFKSSREFFFAPVIEFGPLRDWKGLVGKGQEMQDIFWFIKEAIDAYFGGRAFSVTVVAGCLSGWKATEEEESARATLAGSQVASLEDESEDSEGPDDPAAEVAAGLRDAPENVQGPMGDLADLDEPYQDVVEKDGHSGALGQAAYDDGYPEDVYDDAFAEEEDTLARSADDEFHASGRRLSPVTVEDDLASGDPSGGDVGALVTHPRLSESSMPRSGAQEVSIHELGVDDLEMLEEDDLEDEIFPDAVERDGDEEVDTNVRRVEDLPDHLQKAIRDQKGDEGQ